MLSTDGDLGWHSVIEYIVDRIPGGPQHDALKREEDDQHAADHDRQVVERAGNAERRQDGVPGQARPAATPYQIMPTPKARTTRSEIIRSTRFARFGST